MPVQDEYGIRLKLRHQKLHCAARRFCLRCVEIRWVESGVTIKWSVATTSGGKPLLQGYTSIGFYINGNIRSSISISETTGQAIDMNSCEIFDYPDLRLFQDEMLKLSKARIKTPRDLADDAACTSPKILKTPESRP